MAGVPCHVIQRGNNRDACFFSDDDYRFYLECLKDACKRYQVSCHAYVLMTNHTHLLLSPKSEEGISKVMQSLGRRYVQYINKRYLRCGTLWESRHKSSLIDAESYLLCCYRYIELNPVRANMVLHPGDYRWSSYHCNAHGIDDDIVTAHDSYLSIDTDKTNREVAYRSLFETALSKQLLDEIRNATNFSMPLGKGKFKQQIEESLNRAIGHAKRGRPFKTKQHE
tara:strand:+ start:62 stop:736 length:675 start_codon:yes stop_codon:yes gene_type:complete